MSKLYMLVGIPYAGKSSIVEELEGEVFSSDTLRKELWGNESTQGDNNLLFNTLESRIRKALREGKDCIYDATNIRAKKREHFLRSLKEIDCEKICVFMTTDINVCIERSKTRDRKVPYEVIKRMYLNIDIPQYREGWDRIIIKRTLDKNNNYDIFNFVDGLEKVNHDNPHHMLTIGGHIQAVVKNIMDNYELKFAGDIDRLERLLRAALHHDIGKLFTKSFINSKGEETEVAHYYYHEKVSAYMYLLYEKESEMENIERVLYIADLIGLHMRMHAHGQDREKIHNKIRKMVGQREFEDLCILNEADILCG